MKRIYLTLLALTLTALACNLSAPLATPSAADQPAETATSSPVPNEAFLPVAAASDRPRGIFVLSDVFRPTNVSEQSWDHFNQIVNLDYVDGVTLRFTWSDTETAQGQYDFSAVDTALSILQTTDKKLNIEVFAVEVPTWLAAQLPVAEVWESRAGKRTVGTAVPWSETALSAWQSYMQALADHPVTLPDGSVVRLADHPSLMMVDAPIVGLQGVRDLTNTLTSLPTYKRETFVNAVSVSIHASRDAFPNRFGFLTFFSMQDGNAAYPLDQNLMDRLMQEFNNSGQPTLGFFQENLSDSGPTAKNLLVVKDRTYILFQALTAWSKPFTGEDKVTSGQAATGIQFAYEKYNATYVEIYLDDALDPTQTDDLRKWNDILTGVSAP